MRPVDQSQQLIPPDKFQNSQLASGERFLKFPLNSQINSLLSLSDLRGTIEVCLTEILPVPHIAESWLGIVNWRGEALWILDLACFLGGVHWCRQAKVEDQAMAILIQLKAQTVGLLVRQIHTIESYERTKLLPIPEPMLSQQQHKFFEGYFLDPDGQALMLLDLSSLLTALI